MLVLLGCLSFSLMGCGGTKDKDKVDNTEVVESTEVIFNDLGETETTEVDTNTTEEMQYGTTSNASKYIDKVSEETLTKEDWVRLESNGISFYAPKECNTFKDESDGSSICIVGLNEQLYEEQAKKAENAKDTEQDEVDTASTYGATDLYAMCVIDASSSFTTKGEAQADSTELEEETVTKELTGGVFTKGETDDLVPFILNDDSVTTTTFVDNDDLVIYQLNNQSAYLGFIYGTTNLIEIIFDNAAFSDIYEIENGYIGANYVDSYKEQVGEVGKVAYKAGYFLDEQKEAALVTTITKAK